MQTIKKKTAKPKIANDMYDKPGPINNSPLIRDGRSMLLKDNLVENFDFIAVSAEVWRYLYSWYCSDWCVARLLKKDRTNNH